MHRSLIRQHNVPEIVNLYSLLPQKQRETEENNNESSDKDNNEIEDGIDNSCCEKQNGQTNEENNDNEVVQEPLLEARMGREQKRRQPWHLFLLVSLVKIPSAWQMASILFIAPDKTPGSYWCKGGQPSPQDELGSPCSMLYEVFPTTTESFADSNWMKSSKYTSNQDDYDDPYNIYVSTNNMMATAASLTEKEVTAFSETYYATHSQDAVEGIHASAYNTTGMKMTIPTNISHAKSKIVHEEFEVSEDHYVTAEEGSTNKPYQSPSKSNLTKTMGAQKQLTPCKEFEFSEGYYSIINQWQLVCGRKILPVISQELYLIGVLCGGIIFPYISQKWSPRLILIGGMIVQIIAGIGVAVSPYFTLHCALRFITAAACTQMFTAGYSICTGLMEGKAKIIAGCCYEHLWSVGVITLPCVASLFNDWRHFQLAISLPTAVILLCFRYIPECPDWKPKKKVRKKKQTPLEDCTPKKDKTINEMNGKVSNSAEKFKASLQTLHKESVQNFKNIGLYCTWAFTVVTYYGGLLNVKNLGPELFLNTVTAGAAEVAGVLTGLLILLRKSNIWLSLGVIAIAGGLCCLLTWALPKDLEEWYPQLLLLAMLGRISIACSLTILMSASAKQFPIAWRPRGMFICVILSRLVLLQAPFIGILASYGERVSLSVFGTFTLLAGVSSLINASQTMESENGNTGLSKSSYELDSSACQRKEDVFSDV